MPATQAIQDDWTTKAYSVTGACAVVTGGVLFILARIDKAWMDRLKTWEEFNKTSITQELHQSVENQEKMQVTLYDVRNLLASSAAENVELRDEMGNLRGQFVEVATALRAAEGDLHDTNILLQRALGDVRDVHVRLEACEKDREVMHQQIGKLEKLTIEVRQNQTRIEHMEESGEHRFNFPPDGGAPGQ